MVAILDFNTLSNTKLKPQILTPKMYDDRLHHFYMVAPPPPPPPQAKSVVKKLISLFIYLFFSVIF